MKMKIKDYDQKIWNFIDSFLEPFIEVYGSRENMERIKSSSLEQRPHSRPGQVQPDGDSSLPELP